MTVSRTSRGDVQGRSVASRSLRIAAWHSVGNDVVHEFEEQWLRGMRPDLRAIWSGTGSSRDLVVLSALIKAELRARTELGEAPGAREYLERFPEIRDDRERVVSLIYEEYCLREEAGHAPSAESFCAQYEPWKDSVASQLRYHHILSQVITPREAPRYPLVGETFASTFRLRSVLGEGGAGRVYLAEQPDLGDRAVALKLSPGQSKEPSIQGRLDHEHIVPVWSVVDDAKTGLRGLCMPFRPGRALDQVIRRIDPGVSQPRSARALWNAIQVKSIEPNNDEAGHDANAGKSSGWHGFPIKGTYAQGAAWLIAKVARALAHAHQRGILHRDVKPANILVTARDGPQLLDFNLAHDPNGADKAEAALRGGTLPYMAPEQLNAFLDPARWETVGETADLYSLGLVLEEMLTGRRPPAPEANVPLPRAINGLLDLRRAQDSGSCAQPNSVPRGLGAIIRKCLAFEKADRYTSMLDLADDLERFVARQPLRHVVNPSRREVAGNFAYRQRFTLLAGGVVAALALAFSLVRAHTDPSLKSNISLQLMQTGFEQIASGNAAIGKQSLARAGQLSREAAAQDPRLVLPHLILGHLASELDRNIAESLRHYTIALDLNRHQNVLPPGMHGDLLKNHGTTAYQVAEGIRAKDPSAEGLKSAFAHYQAGFRSLSDASDFEDNRSTLWRIQLRYLLARAHLGLGDAAAARADWTIARAHYIDGGEAARAGRLLVAEDATATTTSENLKRYLPAFDETLKTLASRLEQSATAP